MIRPPVVAGRFYPAQAELLAEAVEAFWPAESPREFCYGLLAPHAGYIYSGPVAGAVYASVEPPDTALILCPNHTGRGARLALWSGDGWQTPTGVVPIDQELSEAIGRTCPDVEHDRQAHAHEHAIEVQLPFLQRLNPAIRIVPIVLTLDRLEPMQRLAEGLAEAVRAVTATGHTVLTVASSDMSHYEPKAVVQAKDRRAIERMLALDDVGLIETVAAEKISMCGAVPAAVMLALVKQLGAVRAEERAYRTSGDETGEYEEVVGYAGITFH